MRRSTLLASLAFCTSLLAQDAYLTNAFVPRYWKANTDYVINVRLRNASVTQIFILRVDWRWNNGPVQQGNTISTTGISGNQYWAYAHPIPFNQGGSAGTLKVWAVVPGEANPANDTLSFPVDVLPAWATKSVLMEQFTGTWCQFCPNPNATTNGLDADPLIVVAKHHNTDDLSNPNSTAYWGQFNANYSPAGVMEQEEFGTLQDDAMFSEWNARAELRKQGVSPVSLQLTTAFSEWTRSLTVDVDATFAAAVSGEFILNAYLLEDNVPGPQIAAPEGYIHHQVVREVLGGAAGTSGVIPATTTAGSTYSHQYTFVVPEQWNHLNMRAVATVTEVRSSGTQTMNVTDGALLSVGISERSTPILSVSQDPATGALWLALREASTASRVQVISGDGRSVIDLRLSSGGAVRVDGFEALAPGAYVVRVQQGAAIGAQRVLR